MFLSVQLVSFIIALSCFGFRAYLSVYDRDSFVYIEEAHTVFNICLVLSILPHVSRLDFLIAIT